MKGMMTGKGVRRNKFDTLAVRKLKEVQIAHLKTKFELAEESFLAEQAVALVNDRLEQYEEKHGQKRIKPGEMLVEKNGEKIVLPILLNHLMHRLGNDMTLKEVKRHHEHEQYSVLQAVDPDATYGDLWRLLGTSNPGKRAPKGYDFLPEEPSKINEQEITSRQPEDLAGVPKEVARECTEILVEEYGCKKGLAEAMIRNIAGTRAWCCPEMLELKPGQGVWLTHSTQRSRKRGPRLLVPVILTLLKYEEQEKAIQHRGEFKAFKLRQIERITSEAWRQGGVLTNTDTEWILGISPNMVREILEGYQEKFGIILPTAGTILDMGRTLTHKKIVVELHLQGMTTKQIAQRIYHSPEAVDLYLKTFDRLLVLRYYGMPLMAIQKVLGHGKKLIKEHLELADKYFPTQEALAKHLKTRGIVLEDLG